MSEPTEAMAIPDDDPAGASGSPSDTGTGDLPVRRAVHRPLSEAEQWELLRLFNELIPPYSITRLGLLHFADQYVNEIPGWVREQNLGDVLDAFQALRASGRMRPGR